MAPLAAAHAQRSSAFGPATSIEGALCCEVQMLPRETYPGWPATTSAWERRRRARFAVPSWKRQACYYDNAGDDLFSGLMVQRVQCTAPACEASPQKFGLVPGGVGVKGL